MKKLLTMLSAATVAIGLYAAYDTTGTSFEGLSEGPLDITDTASTALSYGELLAGGSGEYYWVTNGSENVTLTVTADQDTYRDGHQSGGTTTGELRAQQFEDWSNGKYLAVKTTFGNAVKRRVVAAGGTDSAVTLDDALFFDSLVRFTVFDESPTNIAAAASDFADAKIAVWIQEEEVSGAMKTNLYVRAGTLGGDPVNYNCGEFITGASAFSQDPNAWHRLTIKAIPRIYSAGNDVPGFMVYVDNVRRGTGGSVTKGLELNKVDTKYLSAFNSGDIFPSMVQADVSIASVSFDGQGDIDDLVFTGAQPFDAAGDDAAAIAIFGSAGYPTVAALTAAIANATADDLTNTVRFTASVTEEPVMFYNANTVKIDLNGQNIAILVDVDENSGNLGAVEISDTQGSGSVGTLTAGEGSVINAGTYGANGGAVTLGANSAINGGRFDTNSVDVATLNAFTLPAGKAFAAGEGTDAGYWVLVDATYSVTLAWPSGLTAVSYAINGGTPVSLAGATTGFAITGLSNGDVISFVVQNADGAKKTLTATAGTDTGIDADGTTFGWAEYLGDAVADAYQIDDGADLMMLQKGVLAGLATADVTFKQTANIDMTGVTGFWGVGWFTSSDSKDASITASGDTPFAGTYDGQGYTISNVTIVRHNYAGVFNNVSGTVKNLTVQDIGFSGTCSEWGCAIVGNAASGALLENLTATSSSGFNWGDTANHNVAGVVVRPIGAATIRGCVNNANITASGKRVGGVAAFVGSGSTGTVFDSCTNTAAIISSNGTRGVGGILGCAEGNTTETATFIRNCVDFGSEEAQASGGHAGAIVGSNWNGSYTYTDDGGNTFKASTVDCGYVKNAVFGRAYAIASTIDGTAYLTTVKKADLAAGNTYKLLADVGNEVVFTLASAGDTIAFDSNGFTFGGTVGATGDGVEAVPATSGSVTTYTATITDAWAYRLGAPVNGAYEIDNLAELKAFQAGVAVPLTTAGKTFKLTADIELDAAWEGIGVKAGKDLVCHTSGTAAATIAADLETYANEAFSGTFDGDNHTISNFQMENGTDYGGFFNSVNGATISNLKVSFKENKLCANSSSSGGDTGATFVGVARNSTLQNLTALAGDVTTVSASKDMAGIVGYLMAGSTVDSCTNELNVASLKSSRKCGGIALITQEGSGTATIRNCKNSGTATATSGQFGGIVGYVGQNTTIVDCENTAAVKMLTIMNGASLTMQGTNKGNATVASCNVATNGLNFATVADNVATFVADDALALNGSYKVMTSGATATFEFAEAGTIAFDTNLTQNVTFAITAAEGLTLGEPVTVAGVVTYTATSQQQSYDAGETIDCHGDANAATNLAAAITANPAQYITVPTGISDTEGAYTSLFKGTVTGTSVTIEFTADAALYQATNVTATAVTQVPVATVAAAGSGVSTDAELTGLTPGVYYSVVSRSTLDANANEEWVEGTRVMADKDGEATLSVPHKGTAGFYWIKASEAGNSNP